MNHKLFFVLNYYSVGRGFFLHSLLICISKSHTSRIPNYWIPGSFRTSWFIEGHGKFSSSVIFKAGLFLHLKQNVVTLDTNSLEQSPS